MSKIVEQKTKIKITDKQYSLEQNQEIPFVIERVENEEKIIWYGYSVNWKKVEKQWYQLVDNLWQESEEPIYEQLYLKLKEKYENLS